MLWDKRIYRDSIKCILNKIMYRRGEYEDEEEIEINDVSQFEFGVIDFYK
jgi:hypothetical protein